MRPSHFVGLLAGDDGRAAERRDAEFRAWHRRPDADPLPEEPPPPTGERLTIVRRLARTVALFGVLGRDG
jgi:hypothetical protein